MSFSGMVKEELAKHVNPARHCQLAELAAILHYCGQAGEDEQGRALLQIRTENACVARKYFTLLKKTFNIDTDVILDGQKEERGSGAEQLVVHKEEDVIRILHAVKWMDKDGRLLKDEHKVNPLLVKNACCQRAFLRGAYLAVGSMSDPEKSYHLELVCMEEEQALQLQELIQGFGLEARIIRRKKYHVVYMKEGASIVDFLNIIEAHVALMEFENLRILKEMRNSINRRVNCEAANITKTVNAASKQTEDIILIRDTFGFDNLPEGLRQMAEVRLEHPDATLKELGEFLTPSVGKSGVNHRLRKLSELAEKIRV